jgi:hypothetical protein
MHSTGTDRHYEDLGTRVASGAHTTGEASRDQPTAGATVAATDLIAPEVLIEEEPETLSAASTGITKDNELAGAACDGTDSPARPKRSNLLANLPVLRIVQPTTARAACRWARCWWRIAVDRKCSGSGA